MGRYRNICFVVVNCKFIKINYRYLANGLTCLSNMGSCRAFCTQYKVYCIPGSSAKGILFSVFLLCYWYWYPVGAVDMYAGAIKLIRWLQHYNQNMKCELYIKQIFKKWYCTCKVHMHKHKTVPICASTQKTSFTF